MAEKNSKRQRAGLVSYVKKLLEGDIKEIMTTEQSKLVNDKIEYLVVLKNTVKEKLKSIMELYQEIADEETEDDDYNLIMNDALDYEVKTNYEIRKIENFVTKFSRGKSTGGGSSNVELSTPVSSVQSVAKTKTNVKLPTLKIKQFSGNPADYQSFIESFNVAVHNEKSIPDVQKLNYLLGYLEGEAENLLKGFHLSSENYSKALELLKERFGNKEKLISFHMGKIIELESVSNINDLKALRNLYDTVETQLRNLETFEMKNEEYGPLLIPLLMNKMPGEMQLIISRNISNEQKFDLLTLLDKNIETLTKEKEKDSSNKKEGNDESVSCVAGSKNNNVFLQTATATVSSKTKEQKMRILFDLGSQITYITPKAAERLELNEPIATKDICIKSFNDNSTNKTLNVFEVTVKGKNCEIPVTALCNEICHPLKNQNIESVYEIPEFASLDFADSNPKNSPLVVDMLIGADNYWRFFNDHKVKNSKGTLVAIDTKLGYVLSGSINKNPLESNVLTTHVLECQYEIREPNTDLQKTLNKFWDCENVQESNDEIKSTAIENFENDISFNDEAKRYKVSLPFLEQYEILNDNFETSKRRLKSVLLKHFKSNEELLKTYDHIIKEQIELGVIEEVPTSTTPEKAFYLPHRPVCRDDRITTKVRMVFDASSTTYGPSLNDCLDPGPSLTTSLFGILLRFRAKNIGLVADIEKAFWQIMLNEKDRDFVRFLWLKDTNDIDFQNFDNNQLVTYRICRVLFGVTSSPFLLNGTLRYHINKIKDTSVRDLLLRSLHVDDLTTSLDTEAEACEFYTSCKEHFAEANFNLRKAQSNCESLERNLKKLFTGENQVLDKCDLTKVLGLPWNKGNDKFFLNFQNSLHSAEFLLPTKRNVIQFTSSIFDPLGLINPLIVKLKILFQDICISNTDWDETIPTELISVWQQILLDLKEIKDISFLRPYCYTTNDDPVVSRELHGFSDASKRAYGCCVYLRTEFDSGLVSTSLVTGKSRIAPIKGSTVPKFELCGAQILTIIINQVKSELKDTLFIEKIYAWIDSTVAYCWLKNENKVYKQFVQNRVNEIRGKSKTFVWKLIDTLQNSADDVTRGLLLSQIVQNKRWLNGPEFLSLSQEHWPDLKPGDNFSKQNEHSTTETVNLFVGTEFEFSDLDDEEKVTCLATNTALISFYSTVTILHDAEESINHLVNAKKLWILEVQKEYQSPRYEQLKRSLDVFTDANGILRCKGRLGNAPLPFDTKFPILIPRDSRLAELIVLECHQTVGHNKTKDTLNEIRSQYWIPKGRQLVKKLINSCLVCRLFEGKRCIYPDLPKLPSERVDQSYAFENIGIDYAGPVFVRNNFGDQKTLYKSWIALITCYSTRAVYLDLATSYDSDALIRILERFFNRYNAPKVINSDNGSNFTSNATQDFAKSRFIRWKFNIEAAPWSGGVFERLVQSTKRVLRKSLRKEILTCDELSTLLKRIENILNNRPLTHIYDSEITQPLTPNHLIYGRKIETSVKNTDENENDNEINCGAIKRALSYFWEQWKSEYLTSLRERNVKPNRNMRTETLNVGDVCLIDDQGPRVKWKMGKIEELIKGKDNKVRGAVVKTMNGQLKRPINKLVIIHSNKTDELDYAGITFVPNALEDIQSS
ncbi:uncharacterized protein [Clytia hemisphaerica]|uniref:uncharacterized protein n=1 Tax=Clytia hemisphaerica TaxID=252671 RepID=UPI0034D3AFCD